MDRPPSSWFCKRSSRRRRSRSSVWFAEQLEDRRLLSGGGGIDDFGDDFDRAAPLLLADNGSGVQASCIETVGDVDTFQFVAPVTDRIAVRLETPPGSDLFFSATAFDDATQFITSDFGSDVLLIPAVAGRTYYIQATAFGSTGGYNLSFASAPPDDFGDGFDQAASILLSANGIGVQAGSIEVPGDVDTFQFVAPVTGRIAVRLETAPGSDPVFSATAFDDATQFVGTGFGPHGLLAIPVIVGRTYYIQATAFGSTGGYSQSLAVPPDDFGDGFDQAASILLLADGTGVQAGSIELPATSTPSSSYPR